MVKRLDYWKAKLKVALVARRMREKELTQAERTHQKAIEKIAEIQERIEYEKVKLARAKRPDGASD